LFGLNKLTVFDTRQYFSFTNFVGFLPRKMRLVEGNAKCDLKKKLPVKGLSGMYYLSEA
jgi:hypothetical protein